MSECEYDYKFYFSTPEAAQAALAKLDGITDSEAKAEVLGFAASIDSDSEYLEFINVNQSRCRVSFTTSTSARLNHRLIRASKELGSEFCVVDIFNNQVGEGGMLCLYRGREVTHSQRKELLALYRPHLNVLQAICKGDLAFVKQAIRKGLDVNLHIEGRSLLEIALREEQLDIFKLLLKCKADVNVPAGGEPSLLMYAAKHLDDCAVDFIILLIKLGADTSVRDKQGASVSWYVADISKTLAKMIVKRGVEIVAPVDAYTNKDPVRNLCLALNHGDNNNTIKYFKISAKNKENWPNIARYCAAEDYLAPLNVLLKNGYLKNTNVEELCTLLTSAIRSEGFDCYTTLMTIAQQQNINLAEIAERLIYGMLSTKNANAHLKNLVVKYPQAVTVEAFEEAVDRNQTEYLTLLYPNSLPFKEYEEENGKPLLFDLAPRIKLATLKYLIERGLDVHQQYDDENIVEYFMVDDFEDNEVKRYLINALDTLPIETRAFAFVHAGDLEGFSNCWHSLDDKTIVNSDGDSLLMVACRYPSSPIVPFLLSQGVDVEFKNEYDQSALSQAYEEEEYGVVELLLQNGADADAVYMDEEDDEDEFGSFNPLGALVEKSRALSQGATYLMHAASIGKSELVELFIKHGADVWKQDSSNQDAATYAIMNNHNDCLDILLNTENIEEIIKEKDTNLINMAALACNGEAINQLVALGVSPDLIAQEVGKPPLILAAIFSEYNNSASAVEALINAGAKTGKVDEEGKTALIHACTTGSEAAIAKILEVGGYPEHVDKYAKVAYDYFIESNREATQFNVDDLRKKRKLVVAYKLLCASGKVIMKWIIPAFIVFSVVAYFSEAIGLYGMVAVLIASVVKVGLVLKPARPIEDDEDDEVEEGEAGMQALAGMLTKVGATFNKLAEEEAKRKKEEQAIIDSWDEAEAKAGA